MFLFTLAQSRTHVNTVQNVLHGIAHSRQICWNHTVKVIDLYVTFFYVIFLSIICIFARLSMLNHQLEFN